MIDDVAVAQEEILVTVLVEVEKAGAEADQVPAERGQAGRAAGEDELTLAAVAVQAVELVLEVGDEQRQPAGAVVVGGIDSHAARSVAALVVSHAALRPRLLEAPAAAVEVQE